MSINQDDKTFTAHLEIDNQASMPSIELGDEMVELKDEQDGQFDADILQPNLYHGDLDRLVQSVIATFDPNANLGFKAAKALTPIIEEQLFDVSLDAEMVEYQEKKVTMSPVVEQSEDLIIDFGYDNQVQALEELDPIQLVDDAILVDNPLDLADDLSEISELSDSSETYFSDLDNDQVSVSSDDESAEGSVWDWFSSLWASRGDANDSASDDGDADSIADELQAQQVADDSMSEDDHHSYQSDADDISIADDLQQALGQAPHAEAQQIRGLLADLDALDARDVFSDADPLNASLGADVGHAPQALNIGTPMIPPHQADLDVSTDSLT